MDKSRITSYWVVGFGAFALLWCATALARHPSMTFDWWLTGHGFAVGGVLALSAIVLRSRVRPRQARRDTPLTRELVMASIVAVERSLPQVRGPMTPKALAALPRQWARAQRIGPIAALDKLLTRPAQHWPGANSRLYALEYRRAARLRLVSLERVIETMPKGASEDFSALLGCWRAAQMFDALAGRACDLLVESLGDGPRMNLDHERVEQPPRPAIEMRPAT